jgi:cytochrome c oxidase assembly protein subunit 11
MSAPSSANKRQLVIAWSVAGVVLFMGAMSFAAVPLYDLFCRMTGYGGTTQVATQGSATRGERSMVVRFDSNLGPGLPWKFEPEVSQITLRNGETATVYYRVTNKSDREISAIASYNVTPDQAGIYFHKISCFCFNEQTLKAGETAEWPVVFYLDPALEKAENMKGVEGVTLSYTFFASKKQPQARADVGAEQPKL